MNKHTDTTRELQRFSFEVWVNGEHYLSDVYSMSAYPLTRLLTDRVLDLERRLQGTDVTDLYVHMWVDRRVS